ncbi:Mitochondrial acidic protein mam33 [Spiromyces aspiralis]|uniref:Mitochondrial acidic protein mam33 n=1 Tax=Spiromyces aspiralis TaxID=68401 RepID=A0ACC1HG32_9FUNG|nr:Mitochondrial acidic protein mam33 [Spiromyces aspiralis]
MHLTRAIRPAAGLASRLSRVAVARVAARSALPQLSAAARRAFATTPLRLEEDGSSKDLTLVLQEEIDYERNALEEEGKPEFISSFVEKTGFKIQETEGQNDVIMTRNIHVRFNISEILNRDDNLADVEVYNENAEGVTKEGETPADEELEEFPVSFSVCIVKPNHKSVLSFDLIAEEGEIGVERTMFFPDEATALEQTAERDWQRRGHYMGPVFGHLSDDLKENIDVYLEERGIDTGLCLFMQDYIEHKEEKEYLRWLEQFQKFIKA